MGLDSDGNERVARAARPWLALAGQAHLGAVFHPGGQLQVDGLPIGQGNPLGCPGGRIGQRYAQLVSHVGALGRRSRPSAIAEGTGSAAAKATAPAEQAFEDVAKVDPGVIAAAKAFEPVGAEAALAARAAKAPGAAAKAIAGGVAVDIDLAPVEPGALVLVGQEVIGAGHFRKALRGLGIVGIAVRVELLRQLAIGGLDVLLARAARYAQDRIGIGHAS